MARDGISFFEGTPMFYVSYWRNSRLEYARIPNGKTAQQFLRTIPDARFNAIHTTEEQARQEVDYEMDLAWNSY